MGRYVPWEIITKLFTRIKLPSIYYAYTQLGTVLCVVGNKKLSILLFKVIPEEKSCSHKKMDQDRKYHTNLNEGGNREGTYGEDFREEVVCDVSKASTCSRGSKRNKWKLHA